MAAFCMAVFFRGLTSAETLALTDAMIASGETIDLRAALGRKVVDKHSTGGVGDKTSIAVGPIVAACGVPVRQDERPRPRPHRRHARQARVDPGLPRRAHDRGVRRPGARGRGWRSSAQSADLVPADKKLYALRDVTATVDNVSLIAASIMSKKIAAGADAIVLDVKVGDGAFMKSIEDARALAEAMLELGQRAGREVVCLLTDMDQPLGRAVGNALEIREAIATVRGEGPADFPELVLAACCAPARALRPRRRRGRGARRAPSRRSPTAPRWRPTSAGSARRAATPTRPRSRRRRSCASVPAAASGYVERPRRGRRRRWRRSHLGAGRRTKDDAIDHAVGIVCLAQARRPGRRRARRSPRSTRATEADADEAAREVHGAYDARRRAAAASGSVVARSDRLVRTSATERPRPARPG